MRVSIEDYDRMRAWLARMVGEVFPAGCFTPETHPVVVLDQLALAAPGKARDGLGMAIGDTVEMTSRWSEQQVLKIDRLLNDEGLPSLSEVRLRFSKLVQRVVRRGRIKDEGEYYAVRNAVEQAGDTKDRLLGLLATYEANVPRADPLKV
jgi:hypothetical protein